MARSRTLTTAQHRNSHKTGGTCFITQPSKKTETRQAHPSSIQLFKDSGVHPNR